MSLPDDPGSEPTPSPAAAGSSNVLGNSVDTSPLEELHSAYRSLRNLFNIVLLGLIVLAGASAVLMLREKQMAQRQLQDNARYLLEYRRNLEPKVTELRSQFEAYSKLHPDFAPMFS